MGTYTWTCILSAFTLMFLVWSSHVLLLEGAKEFSLARYGVTFANNSVINIELVGEGYPGITQTNSGALECHTDDINCCRNIDNPNGTGRGEWYYPDGTVVPPPSGDGFYRTRGHMVIRLNRGAGTLSPTGIYRCIIPDAGGIIVTRYIQLGMGLTCDDLPVISNREISYTPLRSVSPSLPEGKRYTGTIATYNCLSGYQLVGGSSLRACGSEWNGTAPSCVTLIDCDSLANPVNGQVDTPSGTTFASTATYTCNTGYIVTGSSSRTCGSDGVWSPAAPTCDIVDCGSHGNPVNGQVDISSGTTYMSTANYTCNAGYNLIGPISRTCGSDGVWLPASPTCEPPTINVTITSPTEPPAFGGSYSLICTVTGGDPSLNVEITYQWFRAHPASSGMMTRVGTDSSRLHLYSLSLSDVGLYTCMTTVSSNLLSEDIESTSETFELKFPALFIQLQLTNIPSCKEYSVLNSRQKIEDIENTMAQNVASLCRCEFNSTLLSNSHLLCFEETPQIVTFRSQLSETSQTSTVELVTYIKLWTSESEGVAVDGVFLGFQTICFLVINSLDAVECSTQYSLIVNLGTVGGVVAAVLLFILVGVAIVTLIVFIKKQRTTQRSQAGNKEEIELQDSGYPASSPPQIPTYEVVDTPGSVEYEEIDKFQGIEEKPVMIEPHPPKGDYMNTLSVHAAYAPTQTPLPPQN